MELVLCDTTIRIYLARGGDLAIFDRLEAALPGLARSGTETTKGHIS